MDTLHTPYNLNNRDIRLYRHDGNILIHLHPSTPPPLSFFRSTGKRCSYRFQNANNYTCFKKPNPFQSETTLWLPLSLP